MDAKIEVSEETVANEKTVVSKKAAAPRRTVASKKAAASKKAVASKKKVSKKKVGARKVATKSVLEKLEDSVVGQPILIADKTFLAGLGLVSQVVDLISRVRSDFDAKFDELAKDGEVVRNKYQASMTKASERAYDRVNKVLEQVNR